MTEGKLPTSRRFVKLSAFLEGTNVIWNIEENISRVILNMNIFRLKNLYCLLNFFFFRKLTLTCGISKQTD